MTDIVERLWAEEGNTLCVEAADEIERLQEALKDCRALREMDKAEIERLRAEIKRLEDMGWPQGIRR